MAVNAYDVQVCLWKMIKLSSKTCFNVSKKHPYISSCLLFMLLLYMCYPLFFWIVIYTLPLAVSTWVVLSISSIRDAGRRCKEEREKERESSSTGNPSKKTKFTPPDSSDDRGEEKREKSFSRVRSVRRRRAKEIAREDEEAQQNAEAKSNTESKAVQQEEKNAVDDINMDMVVEESPKEIREVEAETSKDHKFYQDPDLMRSLKLLRDDEDVRDEANKITEVGISEAERNKRLESLIARRRSRKMLSLQIKRSLMNTDAAAAAAATAPQNIPAIAIPKINTWCSPSSRPGGNFSPAPGSAPSVMIPLRNPFDLPYDPQEEKLDLTGDSFQQEFALGHNRDYTFCRHESFSLGPSLPMEFFDDRDDTSSIDDFGFRRRRSSIGYHFSRPETDQESDTDFGPATEPESGQESESKSNTDSPDDDQIKEVIQVHENDGEEGETRHNGQDELSLSLNSNSSSSSPVSSDLSEDERPVRIINREAILKSLSMRRNSVPDIDTNDQLQENNLSYANSALENASRLKQQYLADKPQKRHGMTFSIASDMQVEVSEISSPPLTIDENMSHQDDASGYDGEMERNASWDGLDSWAGSSRLSEVEDNEMRLLPRAHEAGAASRTKKRHESLNEKHCIHSSSSAAELSDNAESQTTNAEEDVKSAEEIAEMVAVVENYVEHVQRVEGEGEASTNQAAMDSNDLHQERSLMQNAIVERVHHATISPKSVLQPTLSVASFEPDADDEVQLPRAHPADHSSSNAPQNSTPLVQFTVATNPNGDAQVSQEVQESSAESSNEKLKIQENVEKAKEVAGGSSSQMVEINESPAQTRDGSSSSRSLASNVEANDTESVNQKLKIQENDEQPKEVAGGSSSRSFNNTDEVSSEDFEAANPTTLSKNVDQIDNSISSQPNEKDMVIQESTHNDSTKTSSYEGQIGNSVSQEDTGHEHDDLNKPEDLERETKDEVVDSDAGKSKLAVEENDISESFKKNGADEEAEQHANLHEAMPETINSEAK